MAGTIVVTGGAGFLGRHVARALAARGASLRLVDRMAPSEEPFPWGLGGVAGFDFVRADVCDRSALEGAFRGADRLIHLAALSLPARCQASPLEAFRANAQGTANVLDAAATAGVRRVVVASSRLVVDAPQQVYSITKAIAEQWAGLYGRILRGGTLAVRLANVYGPGQGVGTVVSDFLDKATRGRFPYTGDPCATVPLLYVDDAVEALLILLESGGQTGVASVPPGAQVPLLALAERVADLARGAGFAVPSRADGVRSERFRASPVPPLDPALERAGWRAAVGWTEGVRRTWAAWQKRQPTQSEGVR